MKLTVDASVVVKWFVPESLSDEARLLLTHRVELHAPDFLLIEFANTIWKKVRRNELDDPDLYMDELPGLSGVVNLYPANDLLTRATRIAQKFDHPIYDCLYLACAEATESVLVTADQKFVNKLSDTLGSDIQYLGAVDIDRLISDSL